MEVRILVEKWNMYEAHNFPRSLVQISWLLTTSLCINTRLSVKKFQILIIFSEISVTVWLLCAHPLMTSIIFHTLRLNTQENVSYVLGFYVTADDFFSPFFGAKKHVFHIAPFRPTIYVLKIFGFFEVSKRETNWINSKFSFTWVRYFKYTS